MKSTVYLCMMLIPADDDKQMIVGEKPSEQHDSSEAMSTVTSTEITETEEDEEANDGYLLLESSLSHRTAAVIEREEDENRTDDSVESSSPNKSPPPRTVPDETSHIPAKESDDTVVALHPIAIDSDAGPEPGTQKGPSPGDVEMRLQDLMGCLAALRKDLQGRDREGTPEATNKAGASRFLELAELSQAIASRSFSNSSHKERASKIAEAAFGLAGADAEVNVADEFLQTLRQEASRLKRDAQVVDLDKLCDLMQGVQEAADCMEGEDVLLLMGATGAGKTTTALFFAGTAFKLVDVDGFDHLQPKEIPVDDDKRILKFETSCQPESVTRSVQCASVALDGETTIVVADTPGFGSTWGVEMDISGGIGFVNAIHRARSVKPVVVLSPKSMGDRLVGLREILTTVTDMVDGGRCRNPSSSLDLKPFGYLFTKFEPTQSSKICKQMASFRRAVQDEDPVFLDFIQDIIDKTTPEATIAFPLEGAHRRLLRRIWSDGTGRVSDPGTFFRPFVSDNARVKLNLQLKCTMSCLDAAVASNDCESVAANFLQLAKLGQFDQMLPDALPYAQSARKALEQYVASRRTEIRRLLGVGVYKSFANVEEIMGKGAKFMPVLADLKQLGHVVGRFPGGECVTVEYEDGVEKWILIMRCVLGRIQTDSDPSFSPDGLKDFETRSYFLFTQINGLREREGNGETKGWSRLETDRVMALDQFVAELQEGLDTLKETANQIRTRLDAGTEAMYSFVAKLDVENLGDKRELILSAAGLKGIWKLVDTNMTPLELQESVQELERLLTNYLQATTVNASEALNRLLEEKKDLSRVANSSESRTLLDVLCLVPDVVWKVCDWSSSLEEQLDPHAQCARAAVKNYVVQCDDMAKALGKELPGTKVNRWICLGEILLPVVLDLKRLHVSIGSATGCENVTAAFNDTFKTWEEIIKMVLGKTKKDSLPCLPSDGLQDFERCTCFLREHMVEDVWHKCPAGSPDDFQRLHSDSLRLLDGFSSRLSACKEVVQEVTKKSVGMDKEKTCNLLSFLGDLDLEELGDAREFLSSAEPLTRIWDLFVDKQMPLDLRHLVVSLEEQLACVVRAAASCAGGLVNGETFPAAAAADEEEDKVPAHVEEINFRALDKAAADLKLVFDYSLRFRSWSMAIQEETEDDWRTIQLAYCIAKERSRFNRTLTLCLAKETEPRQGTSRAKLDERKKQCETAT